MNVPMYPAEIQNYLPAPIGTKPILIRYSFIQITDISGKFSQTNRIF